MEIDESLLQSSEHDNAAMPTIEGDNQLLYEGDDGFSADVNNELSYAPEDVDALLGDDDNEDVDNAVEEYATEEDVVYDQGEDGSEYTETAEEEGVDTSESQEDSKEKSKLVKTPITTSTTNQKKWLCQVTYGGQRPSNSSLRLIYCISKYRG